MKAVCCFTPRRRASRFTYRSRSEVVAVDATGLRSFLLLDRRQQTRRGGAKLVKPAAQGVSRQLVAMVDDLLEISRITRGKLELHKTRVTLADIVDSAVERRNLPSTKRGIG